MMQNTEVRSLVMKLNWNNPESEKALAYEQLKRIRDDQIDFLLFNNNDKSVWENCASLLRDLGIEKCISVIPKLFEWLQDPNWPGYKTIFDFLSGVPTEQVIAAFRKAVIIAFATKDGDWMGSLKRMFFLYEKTASEDMRSINSSMFDIADW